MSQDSASVVTIYLAPAVCMALYRAKTGPCPEGLTNQTLTQRKHKEQKGNRVEAKDLLAPSIGGRDT